MAGLLRCWASVLVMLGAAGALGCDSGATSTEGGAGSGGTGGPLCPEDPAEGAVLEECGIWVSASKGDDTNKGTQGAPVATLAHAIELAAGGPGRVYACGETWTEALMVPSGVSLHGGFDCEKGWTYVGEEKPAQVTPPSTIGLMWIDSGSTVQSWLTDFYVEAIAATEPGGSSIALFIRDQVRMHVKRCELVAGDGADGADGAPGDPDGLPAASGTPGNDGESACNAALNKGGAAPESTCEGGATRGGKGGDSSVMVAESGETGEPIGAPPGGTAGLGEAVSPSCTPGIAGNPGEEGEIGWGGGELPGETFGRLTVDGIIPYAGQDGKTGAPGQGGGGGGATFGSVAVCGSGNSGGAAGGSGGAGGCGGKGGKGGQGGGWSVAIATRGNYTDLAYNTYRTGNAGNGGNGGAPQDGGAGGKAGIGGKGAGTISLGCVGGAGGPGGKGGFGGGGHGGSTISIVVPETQGFPTDLDSSFFYGEYGLGGTAGPKTHNAGRDGTSGQYAFIDP